MPRMIRSEEHTSELQSQSNLVCRLLLEKKKKNLKREVAVGPMRIHRYYASDHLFFFFNDTATTEIYTLSLHDALPIRPRMIADHGDGVAPQCYLRQFVDQTRG